MLKKIIDRPVTVTMITLVVIVLGLVSLRLLPVSLIPDVDIPFITVQVTSADLSVREMDETVLKPLRQQLIQINGLEDIVCEAKDGSGTINLTFSHGLDIDYLIIEVNETIDRCMSFLQGIPRPKVFKASAVDIPAFYLIVAGNEASFFVSEDALFPVSDAFSELSRFVSDVLIKRIEQLPEVAMADISGTINDEILILPDQEKLRLIGMTMDEFESSVRSINVSLGSLSIRDGEYSYSVKFDSRASSAEDIASIWIKNNGRLLQLREVARVITHPSKRTGLVHSDGKDAICVAIIKQSEAKMSALKKSMNDLMDQFKSDYPSLEIKITRDQTDLLEYSINNLLLSIILALFFACTVIFLFMRDFRSPALVVLSMPVALVFSILCFHVVGLSINIISLSGLLLGIGMMTDNAVILVDNITGRWQRGDGLRQAVLVGTSEVITPMLCSVLTTCAVFLPLVFLGGVAGALFHDQAISVSIVLLTSYVVTVTVIPVFYYWWNKGKDTFSPNGFLEKINFETHLQKWDDRWMSWCLMHRPLAWWLLVFSMIGLMAFFILMPKERLPEMTRTDTIIHIDWNEQLAIENNTERILTLERLLSGKVSQITAFVGAQEFVLNHSGNQGISEASIYIDCMNQGALDKVIEELCGYISSKWPVALFSFSPSDNLFDMVFSGKEAKLTAKLRSVKTDGIDVQSVRSTLSSIRAALPGISIPDPSVKTDVLFVADPDLLALYGVSMSDLLSSLRNSLNENRLFNIVQGTRSVPVVTGSDILGLSDILLKTFVEKREDDGQTIRIPVSDLMRQTFVEDFKTVVAGPEGNYYPVNLDLSSKGVKQVIEIVNDIVRKDGVFEVGFSGSWFSNRIIVDQMIFILLIAILLLYFILASQFESLIQPLIILSEVVIDIFFALLAMWTFGVSINLMSLIGLVVISGIVINDSILKIDTINRMRKEGKSLENAVFCASSRRIKAIIMTSLTTILAVCPFLVKGSMGADLQYPMSLVIIVGMLFGTLVSLFVVPTLYYSIYNGRKDR